MLDGIVSILFYLNQSLIEHIVRIIRVLIGLYLIYLAAKSKGDKDGNYLHETTTETIYI